MSATRVALDPGDCAATAGVLQAVDDDLHSVLAGVDASGVEMPPDIRSQVDHGLQQARTALGHRGEDAHEMGRELIHRAKTIMVGELSGGGGRAALVAQFGRRDADLFLRRLSGQLQAVQVAHYYANRSRFAGAIRSKGLAATQELAEIETRTFQTWRRIEGLGRSGTVRDGRTTRAFKDEIRKLERLRAKELEAAPAAARWGGATAALTRLDIVMNSRKVRFGGAALGAYSQYRNSNFKSQYGKLISGGAGSALTTVPPIAAIDFVTFGGASAAPETVWALGSGLVGAATGDRGSKRMFDTWVAGTYEGHSGSVVKHVNNYANDHLDLFNADQDGVHFERKPWKWVKW